MVMFMLSEENEFLNSLFFLMNGQLRYYVKYKYRIHY